jgi:hypothetical protein
MSLQNTLKISPRSIMPTVTNAQHDVAVFRLREKAQHRARTWAFVTALVINVELGQTALSALRT